ncbi:hypothetical protein DFJ74DRAFT_713813 [Hyaloraphidium curvatum]|nr:hypothetical protein DFJ74DRAFT_713813 [Hyaloraphidium curvatum]
MTSRVEIAKAYFDSRASNDAVACMSLVSDAIVFESAKDGVFRGRDEFQKYLTTVPPSGPWQDAKLEEVGGQVVLTGKVKWMMVPVKVKSEVSFDADGKISHIVSGRA